MLPKTCDFRRQTFGRLPEAGVLREIALSSPGAVFLDSSMKQDGYGERDMLFLDPAATLQLPLKEATLLGMGKGPEAHRLPGNPFVTMEMLLAESEAGDAGLFSPPFLAGYISYEAGRFAERMPVPAEEGPDLPEIHMICPATVVIADRAAGTTLIVSADGGTEEIAERVFGGGPGRAAPDIPRTAFGDTGSSLPLPEYLEAAARTVEYIRAGDIFQANLTRQLYVDAACGPADVYTRLARFSPAPYSAWIDTGGNRAVLSSSMELFLRVRGREVTTRPIKGTIQKGRTIEEDELLMETLRRSAKDLAELTMIIDLERNDLGRVSRTGSVSVPDLYTLESFPHVHHLVSTVRGELRDGAGMGALLNATLPGGSITGAPKVRAMEIIRELEPMRRSAYTGVIGWMDSAGNAEFNIAIRTIMMDGGRAWFPAGGGIVADSVPEKEYEETLHKARGMAMALGIDWPGTGDNG
ncbi:MAG: aminodeoxychorismate synthase component I [Planctomycetes bacterium]|nr:aminodeoxychorismate synthase component I [Planctomycetota bacterium]